MHLCTLRDNTALLSNDYSRLSLELLYRLKFCASIIYMCHRLAVSSFYDQEYLPWTTLDPLFKASVKTGNLWKWMWVIFNVSFFSKYYRYFLAFPQCGLTIFLPCWNMSYTKKSTEGVFMCIIIGDVHQFNGHSLIILDPWVESVPWANKRGI